MIRVQICFALNAALYHVRLASLLPVPRNSFSGWQHRGLEYYLHRNYQYGVTQQWQDRERSGFMDLRNSLRPDTLPGHGITYLVIPAAGRYESAIR